MRIILVRLITRTSLDRPSAHLGRDGSARGDRLESLRPLPVYPSTLLEPSSRRAVVVSVPVETSPPCAVQKVLHARFMPAARKSLMLRCTTKRH